MSAMRSPSSSISPLYHRYHRWFTLVLPFLVSLTSLAQPTSPQRCDIDNFPQDHRYWDTWKGLVGRWPQDNCRAKLEKLASREQNKLLIQARNEYDTGISQANQVGEAKPHNFQNSIDILNE